MNNKRLLIISVILMLFIISISSVSAGEIETDEDLTINEELAINNGDLTNINENNEETNLISNVENTIVDNIDESNYIDLNDDELKTNSKASLSSSILSDPKNITVTEKKFAAIQNAVNNASDGDTIILSGTYSNNMYQPIAIAKNLTFIGFNNAILDAGRSSSIFNITGQVTIMNITFKNGKNEGSYYYENKGGALNGGTAVNCTFIDNYAEYSGGAMYGGSAINCTFINNAADYGGAKSAGNAINCTFINNTANENGGAIFNDNNNWANYWNGSIFINNSAKLGGAIYDIGNEIINASFINNHASIDGSAIFINSKAPYSPMAVNRSCWVSGCNFINCSDTNIISIVGCPTFYINNANFIKCNSSNGSSYFIVFENVQNTEIFNNSFANCSFRANGGIFYLNYTFSQSINISSCTFERNEYNDNRGLFHSNRRDIYFDNCSFINHNFNSDGILLVDGSSPADLVNCQFKNNYVYDNGTILSINNYKFSFGTCHFINNTIRLGSLILVENDLSTVSNLDFENNTVYDYGLFDLKGENCTISNCNFIHNFANNNGILNFENLNLCNLVDCYFELNNASKSGGTIFSNNSSLSINRCTFNNNSATNGGAIYSDGKNILLNITDCLFEKNAIRAIHTTSDMKIVNSTFNYNVGAILLEDVSSSEFDNCTFYFNHASQYGLIDADGGAIYSLLSNFTIGNCNFIDNSAGTNRKGGAICSDDSNFEINNSYFSLNGGIFNSGGDIFTNGFKENSLIINSIFEENQTQADYGGIKGNCIISDSTFRNYHVPPVRNSVCTNCLFENNSLIAYISNCTAINCTFQNNKYIISDSNVTNCTFINNSDSSGGAISFTSEDSYEVINCIFINNTASENGGAISVVNASVNIVNSTFENNTCNGSGGAVFLENASEVSISNCGFENCTSGDGSDSIVTDNAESLDVSDCIFDVVPEGIPVYYDSILLADDLSFAIDANGILVANLSDVRGPLVGKTITLTIEGNDYTNTTDANGLAKFNMKNYFTSVGNYTVTLSFAGEETIGPNSTNVNISIYNYKGLLYITSTGKYYNDVNVSFKLYDMNTVKVIPNAKIQVVFSNGVTVNLVTGSDGIASYILPFAPGTYNLTATVNEEIVDVTPENLNNIVISPIVGEISVSQAENILSVRLFNPENGDTYRNVNVTLKFDNLDPFNLTTNDQGIVNYDMTELGFGVYNALVMVTGEHTNFKVVPLDSIEVKNYTHDKTNSQVSFSGPIVFDYGKTGSVTVAVVGGVIELANIKVDGHPEAKISIGDKVIKVSGLKLGSYTLHVKTTPDDDHYSVSNTIGITVRKVSAVLQASNHAVFYKENKKWNIKLIDTRTKKPIAKMPITLKVYTGKKYKTIKLTTNAKGIASIKASTWAIGKHKVIMSFSQYGHTCKNLVRYVTVKKRVKLTYEVKSDALVDGSNLFVWAKQGKKPINKVKLRVLVYTGKKYKEYDLVTGNYKSDGKVKKGFIGYGTNMLSVGKHKIVIKPYAYKFTGSKTTYLTIKKSAKKYKQSQVFVSNGKRSMNY